jgi:hypothetical protein
LAIENFFLQFELMMQMIETLGMPSQALLERAPKASKYFERAAGGIWVPRRAPFATDARSRAPPTVRVQ